MNAACLLCIACHLLSCMAYFLTLKMGGGDMFSETSVDSQQTACFIFSNHHCENLHSYKVMAMLLSCSSVLHNLKPFDYLTSDVKILVALQRCKTAFRFLQMSVLQRLISITINIHLQLCYHNIAYVEF
jgi:hypothetical protein